MMDDILSLERRRFLQQSSGAVAVATLGTATAASAGDTRILVVYRPEDAESRAFAEAMYSKGMQTVALGNDVVRQWRDELHTLVVQQGYKMMGRTGYADYFLLRGLAAEHRLFPQHEQQPTHYSFDWVIQEQA